MKQNLNELRWLSLIRLEVIKKKGFFVTGWKGEKRLNRKVTLTNCVQVFGAAKIFQNHLNEKKDGILHYWREKFKKNFKHLNFFKPRFVYYTLKTDWILYNSICVTFSLKNMWGLRHFMINLTPPILVEMLRQNRGYFLLELRPKKK